MRNFNACIRAFALFLVCATTATALPAQTFTTLYSFDSAGGARPSAALLQASDGNLYGTTKNGGGAGSYGTVFKITPGGTLTTLYDFCPGFTCPDGADPLAGLLQATDGNFYGTTYYGAAGHGNIFKITPSGKLKTLYSFCSQSNCTDGSSPMAGLVQAADGNFYGTTEFGGSSNRGTIFRITPSGTLRTLYSFCSQAACADGQDPLAAVIQAANGNFYGTTSGGGANGSGTIFQITPAAVFTTLYSFCSQSGCSDGQYPAAALVQATDGNFYGTTEFGGAFGTSYTGGTAIKITPSGVLTTLYSFCAEASCSDGDRPKAGLVQATDGSLYGTTCYGGAHNVGTVFKLSFTGTMTMLHSFCDQAYCPDGIYPEAGLVQATDGNFYGTTYYGGARFFYGGTVFSLSVGLRPFVEAQPAIGKVGAPVNILGTNLTAATSVMFNGTAAVFTVNSHSLIATTVPAGATSGKVQVVTPGRMLSSNVVFRVRP